MTYKKNKVLEKDFLRVDTVTPFYFGAVEIERALLADLRG